MLLHLSLFTSANCFFSPIDQQIVTAYPHRSYANFGDQPDLIPVPTCFSSHCYFHPTVLLSQESFRWEKIQEIQACWNRRHASMLHLELQDLPDIHPRFQNHELIATRPIPTGALLCGTELARFQRGSAALFHHSPSPDD